MVTGDGNFHHLAFLEKLTLCRRVTQCDSLLASRRVAAPAANWDSQLNSRRSSLGVMLHSGGDLLGTVAIGADGLPDRIGDVRFDRATAATRGRPRSASARRSTADGCGSS